MSRRTSLPGAAELFRATSAVRGPTTLAAEPELAAGEPADRDEERLGEPTTELSGPPPVAPVTTALAPDDLQARRATSVRRTARRRAGSAGDRSPSGRERHEEKITVYCSADELLDLESARLALRADHGLAVDRGRIVREALAVVLADLEAKGESSVIVRRLTGR